VALFSEVALFSVGVNITSIFLLIAAVCRIDIRALLAKIALQNAMPLASKIQSEVISRNGGAAGQTFKQLSEHSKSAASLTSDPVWRVFEGIP